MANHFSRISLSFKHIAFSLVIMVLFVFSSFAFGRSVQDYLPTGWGSNDDLKTYIQNAFDNETLIEFDGSGDVNNPLIYSSTAGLIVGAGKIVTIDKSAVLRRLPSEGKLLELTDAELKCISWGSYRGRIDGNKYAHWPAFQDLGHHDNAVNMMGDCEVSKIYVYDNPGIAFRAYATHNNTVTNCKAENCGYIDVKFGDDYYRASYDQWAADSFNLNGSGNLVQDCISIDAQRWDYCPSHEGATNNTYIDSTGQDINFRTYGFVDIEDASTGNTLIRVNSITTAYDTDRICVSSPESHLTDCDVGNADYLFRCNIDGSTIDGGDLNIFYIGSQYMTATIGTITVTGNLNLSGSLKWERGSGVILQQDSGTIAVGNDIYDEPYPTDTDAEPVYTFTQYGNVDVGRYVLIGNSPDSVGTHNIFGDSVLNLTKSGTEAGMVYGYEGHGFLNIASDINEAITESSGSAVPMAIRWYNSGYGRDTCGALQGYGKIALTGWFVNNGKVIADGDGIERVLDLGSFASINNNFDPYGTSAPQDVANTTDNGWYAVNKGKLVLPGVSVPAGNSSVNWGERPEDGTIDLVNSLCVQFSNVGTGLITYQQGLDGYDGTEDAFLMGNNAAWLTLNTGGSNKAKAMGVPWGGAISPGLVQFNSIAIPEGAEIVTAKLTLTAFEVVNTGGRALRAYPMLTDWVEGNSSSVEEEGATCFSYRCFRTDGDYAGHPEDTWGNSGVSENGPVSGYDYSSTDPMLSQVALGESCGSWSSDGTVFVPVEFDVMDMVNAWLSGELANNGMYIYGDGYWDGITFYPSESPYASSRPMLVVDYSPKLNISLLASDRDEASGGAFVGVWDVNFDGSFDSATLTFRYDHNAASGLGINEADLKVYQRNEGSLDWIDVTSSVDTVNKHITTVPVTAFSTFAVGTTPLNCGDLGTVYLTGDISGPAEISDCYVNLYDFAIVAGTWLDDNCDLSEWCDGADFNESGEVDTGDLSIFAERWFECSDPANDDCGVFWK